MTDWRTDVFGPERRFDMDYGASGLYQSVACDQLGCRRSSYGHPTRCELHRHRDAPVLPPDVAALIGQSNTWARQEER